MNNLTKEQVKRFDEGCKELDITLLFSDSKILKQHLADEIAGAREEGKKEEENRWINQSANEHDNRIKEEAVGGFLYYMDNNELWNSHWDRQEIISRVEDYINKLKG